MEGLVINLQGGLYKVKTSNDLIFNCKASGNLRHKKINPVVGDKVKIDIIDEKKLTGYLVEVFDRKNKLTRPNVSNVDYALIVNSAVEPNFNDYLLDKMLFVIENNNIEPIIIFTKLDLLKEDDKNYNEVINEIKIYKKYYKVIETNKDLFEIEKILKYNSISVITGQTGVGKSTLLNKLNKDLNLNTSEISKTLGRGKHTTRDSKLLEIFKDKYIIDTPGFSSFDLSNIEMNQIGFVTKPFKQYLNKCKFNNCKHINEPKCEVKKDLENNKFEQSLYNNYLKIVSEINS